MILFPHIALAAVVLHNAPVRELSDGTLVAHTISHDSLIVFDTTSLMVSVNGEKLQVHDSLARFDTTERLVTEDDFARLRTFFIALAMGGAMGTPDVQHFVVSHQMRYPILIRRIGMPELLGYMLPMPNYPAIIEKVPSMKTALDDAKMMTVQELMQLTRTLAYASFTDVLDRAIKTSNGAGLKIGAITSQNIGFIRTHQAQYEQLIQLGLVVVQYQVGGMSSVGGGQAPLLPMP